MCWRACLVLALAHACWAARIPKDSADEKPPKSPAATIVFDRMVSFPEDGKTDAILLRNIGGKTVDMKGWWLSDARNDKSNPEATYFFGETRGCGGFRKIPPGGVLELTPYLKSNPCGFPFGVSNEEKLHLFNDEDDLVAYASWDWSLQGLVMRRLPDGGYMRFQENKKTMNILHDMEDSYLFIEALKGAGLYEGLYAESTKDSKPLPDYPFKSPNEVLPFQLADATKGGKMKKSSKWPVKDQRRHFNGIPSEGPFTILAPTSEAIKEFLETWEPAKGLNKWEVFKLKEFKEIMEYHIIPGNWMSGWILDDLPISTSAGKDLVALKGAKTGGDILFHEACNDVEAPEKYSCKSCGRCKCTEETCAKVVQADIYGTNGFIHVINKVLIPGKPSKEDKDIKSNKSPASGSLDPESDNKENNGEDSSTKEDEGDDLDGSDMQFGKDDETEAASKGAANKKPYEEEEDGQDVESISEDAVDTKHFEDGEASTVEEESSGEPGKDTKDSNDESLGEQDESPGVDAKDQSDNDVFREDSRVLKDEDEELEKAEPFSLLTKPGKSGKQDEEEGVSPVDLDDSSSQVTEDDPTDKKVEMPEIVDIEVELEKATKERQQQEDGAIDMASEDDESDDSKKPISKRATRRVGVDRKVPTGL